MDAEFYKQLLDELYDGVYFVDRSRTICYWNHAAERLSGYTSAEVLGRRCADNLLRHIDDKGRRLCLCGCPLAATIDDGAMREADVYLHHKAGHRVPIRVRATPIRNAAGEIIGAVEIFSDNSPRLAMAQQIEELQQMSLLDELTRLSNRRYLKIGLEARIEELRHCGMPFGILYIDIDHFKDVNDTYGHDVGDMVLRMVALSLSNGLRPVDQIGRWGGEEFLAIVRPADAETLTAIGHRLRALVQASALPHANGAIRVTVSIGATLGRPDDSDETILKRADALLYHSKTAGRNRVTLGLDE